MLSKVGCLFCKKSFLSKKELLNHWNMSCTQLCKCQNCNNFWSYSEIYDGDNYIVYFNLRNVHMPKAFLSMSPPIKRRSYEKIHE
jgi:hypothetical protein